MSRNRRRLLIWSAAAAAVLLVAVPLLAGAFGSSAEDDEQPIFKVRRGPLVISVIESGTIKNREEVEIKSQVEGRTAILTLVPECTQAQPGDLLVELDSSKL